MNLYLQCSVYKPRYLVFIHFNFQLSLFMKSILTLMSIYIYTSFLEIISISLQQFCQLFFNAIAYQLYCINSQTVFKLQDFFSSKERALYNKDNLNEDFCFSLQKWKFIAFRQSLTLSQII